MVLILVIPVRSHTRTHTPHEQFVLLFDKSLQTLRTKEKSSKNVHNVSDFWYCRERAIRDDLVRKSWKKFLIVAGFRQWKFINLLQIDRGLHITKSAIPPQLES